jgi:hypothetical protein
LKADKVETFDISFCTIRSISQQPSNPSSFKLQLSAAPQVTLESENRPHTTFEMSVTVALFIEEGDVNKFSEVLESRRLISKAVSSYHKIQRISNIRKNCKLSTANRPITLDFDTDGKSYQVGRHLLDQTNILTRF